MSRNHVVIEQDGTEHEFGSPHAFLAWFSDTRPDAHGKRNIERIRNVIAPAAFDDLDAPDALSVMLETPRWEQK